MRVRYGARSDVGFRREINQDRYGVSEADLASGKGRLLVVCDGMGGHAAGEVASRIGVDAILEYYTRSELDSPAEILESAFAAANEQIYAQGRGSMGTTGVAALIRDGVAYIANVGDSRAYLVHSGNISQISRDHSLVSDQVKAGVISDEEARHSNIRNIITRALGHQSEVQVDIFTVQLQPGDTVVLSTDGLHGLVEDAEIAEVVTLLSPDEAAQRLVDQANERGGVDNITVIVAHVEDDGSEGTGATAAQKTIPLPISETATADESSPVASAATAAPESLAPHRELSLSRRGLLLAGLTLIVLIGLGSFVLLNPDSVSAPGPTSVAPTIAAPATATATLTTTVISGVTPTVTITSATPIPPTPPRDDEQSPSDLPSRPEADDE